MNRLIASRQHGTHVEGGNLASWQSMSEIDSRSEDPPATLEQLTTPRSTNPSWRVDLVLPEIGGGKLAMADLDAIWLQPRATALWVSGLDQVTFERLVERHGQQFTALHLWKCPRIEDFSPLESLTELALVSIYWNQRTSKLWNLARTPKLRGLEFEDFSRLRDLEDLRNAVAIEELSFGNKIWVKTRVASLEPVGEVRSVRHLSFAVDKVEDGRIQPLARLTRLEHLECPTNLFTTEQLAWLRARLPATATGRVLGPVQQLDRPLAGHGPVRDTLVIGKRKPFLNSHTDAARLQRYVAAYWTMVARFRENPALEPASA